MVAFRRILPVAALLLLGCSSEGTAGTPGSFVGTGAPGTNAENPGTGATVPASSDAIPATPTPDSVCTELCNVGLRYACVSVDTGVSVSACTTACLDSFDQLTKEISLECWGAIIQIIQCADRVGALSCGQKCDQNTGTPNGQPSGASNCTSDLKIDEAAAAKCIDIANKFPQCNFTIGGSTTNCDGIQDPCAQCECQHGLDTAACADQCSTGGNCQQPACGGCSTPCDTCMCQTSGDATACASLCG